VIVGVILIEILGVKLILGVVLILIDGVIDGVLLILILGVTLGVSLILIDGVILGVLLNDGVALVDAPILTLGV
jgi:hypothetical protein